MYVFNFGVGVDTCGKERTSAMATPHDEDELQMDLSVSLDCLIHTTCDTLHASDSITWNGATAQIQRCTSTH